MENTQMMAIKITKKTWPIATACLAGGFAREPFEKVKGCYLVINEIERLDWEDHRAPSGIALGNSWVLAAHFEQMFEFVGKKQKGEFTPVRFKAQEPPQAITRIGYSTPITRRRTEKEIAQDLDISVAKLRETRALARKIAIAER